MHKKILFLVIYFISPLLPILAIYSSSPDKYSDINYLIPMVLGAVAYTWLVAEFILSARPKFIEHFFGLDKFYRFHGLMAVISVAMVFIHKIIQENLMGEFITSQIGDIAWIMFIIVAVLALVFMANTVLLKLKPLLMIRNYAEKIKVSKHEYQVLIHNLAVAGLILLFVHVMLTTSSKMSLLVRMIYILYFAIAVAFYVYHKFIRLHKLKKNMYIIKNIIEETPNVWTIRLVPENGKLLAYNPGQFGFIRFPGGNVKNEEHPFSISSAPGDKYISVTIKELGDFTSQIKELKIGQKALLDAPYGKFSYVDYPRETGTALIVGGIGITPALSMLRHIRLYQKDRPTILIWGINDRNDLFCADELEQAEKEMKNFKFIPVMFKDDSWQGERGVIDVARLKRIFSTYDIKADFYGFYVCGPAVMLQSVVRSLKSLGIRKNKIHFERFSI